MPIGFIGIPSQATKPRLANEELSVDMKMSEIPKYQPQG